MNSCEIINENENQVSILDNLATEKGETFIQEFGITCQCGMICKNEESLKEHSETLTHEILSIFYNFKCIKETDIVKCGYCEEDFKILDVNDHVLDCEEILEKYRTNVIRELEDMIQKINEEIKEKPEFKEFLKDKAKLCSFGIKNINQIQNPIGIHNSYVILREYYNKI